MGKITELLKRYEEESIPFSGNDITNKWNAKLGELGLDDIEIDGVEVQPDGVVRLSFTDSSGDFFTEIALVVKSEDGEDIPYAVSGGDEDGVGALELNLSGVNAPIIDAGIAKFIDATDTDWITKEVALSLMSADSVIDSEPEIEQDEVPGGDDTDEPEPKEPDEESDDELEEPSFDDEDDDDEDPKEKYIGLKWTGGRLRAEKVTKNEAKDYKILARRPREEFRNLIEKSKVVHKEGSKRRSSIKSRKKG